MTRPGSVVRRLATWVVAGVLVALGTGCNTIEGLGKDVKAAGTSVEKAAAKNKAY